MANAKHKHQDFLLADLYFEGNRNAGQALFESVFPQVKAFIYVLPQIQGLSEKMKDEIFSDTMMTSLEKIGQYRGDSSFFTFVCGIAKKKILEKFRYIAKENKIMELIETTNIFDDPLVILIEKERIEAMQKSLAMLTDTQLEIVKLKFYGLSSKDIAVMKNMSVDAVKSSYYRSVKIARNNFKKYF